VQQYLVYQQKQHNLLKTGKNGCGTNLKGIGVNDGVRQIYKFKQKSQSYIFPWPISYLLRFCTILNQRERTYLIDALSSSASVGLLWQKGIINLSPLFFFFEINKMGAGGGFLSSAYSSFFIASVQFSYAIPVSSGFCVPCFHGIQFLAHSSPGDCPFSGSFPRLFWVFALFQQSFACALPIFPVSSLQVCTLFQLSSPLFHSLLMAEPKEMWTWLWVSVFSSFLILHYALPVYSLNSCLLWVCALFLTNQASTSPSSIFSFPFGFSPLLAIKIWSLLFDFGSLNLVLMVNIEW